jgi:hypothetical protein
MSEIFDSATIPETTTEMPVGVSKIVELPSGKVATIFKGKGKHVREAQRLMGEDSTLYLNALMSMLIHVDGKPMLMEEFDEMDMEDYTELMAIVGGNFTKSAQRI